MVEDDDDSFREKVLAQPRAVLIANFCGSERAFTQASNTPAFPYNERCQYKMEASDYFDNSSPVLA